jgi:hypothetical protein
MTICCFLFRFRTDEGNFFQITADASYPGNISQTTIENIIRPILANLPPQFHMVLDNSSLTSPDDVQPLSRKKLLNRNSSVYLIFDFKLHQIVLYHMDIIVYH